MLVCVEVCDAVCVELGVPVPVRAHLHGGGHARHVELRMPVCVVQQRGRALWRACQSGQKSRSVLFRRYYAHAKKKKKKNLSRASEHD